jgi:iron complex transport system substrate-binding protein
VARRIVSFLPSATEMVYALGLADQLLGVTHECDYPPAAREKPVVVRSMLPVEQMTQREIDAAVTERLRSGLSLYQVDEARMRDIRPDLILTQDLCQVCAPSGNEVAQLLASLSPPPEILWLTPRSIAQIFDNLRQVGNATATLARAESLIGSAQARLDRIATRAATASTRPRVFCMEWLDPVYCSGHWVPEMVVLAGGQDALGRLAADSVRIPWEQVLAWAPEIVVLCPCGFSLAPTIKQAGLLAANRGWADLPAARTGQIYAVDASAYFARPGPRVVDGTELLAHLIHPELFAWHGPQNAFRRLDPTVMAGLDPAIYAIKAEHRHA